MKKASNIARDNLVTLGVCFGKFTKSLKFKLHVTCLDFISQFAKVDFFLTYSTKYGLKATEKCLTYMEIIV